MFFSSKTITVEFDCNKADWPKMLAEPPADIVFDYTYMGEPFDVKSVIVLHRNMSLKRLLRIFKINS